jgi:hypothetical protein
MAAYQVLLLNTAVPQIQAAQAGDTYVVPRDIAVTADLSVTGNTTLGDASTDTVQVNGYMGVGGAASTGVSVYARNTALTASSQVGFQSQLTATSNATTAVYGVYVVNSTEAASFNIGNSYGVRVANLSLGAGSSATNQHGLHIADLSAATNNYGITSLVSSGTNKWNIYASGTAANYFKGDVGINGATPEAQLDIYNPSGASGLVVKRSTTTAAAPFVRLLTGASQGLVDATGGMLLRTTTVGSTSFNNRISLLETEAVFNDPGNDYDFRVESDTNTHALFVQGSDGNVGIGTSSPGAQLDITGTIHLTSTDAFLSNVTTCLVGRTSGTGSGIFGEAGHLVLQPRSSAGRSIIFGTGTTSAAEVARITSVGNVSIGGTSDRATTVGTKALNIFNGTAPVGTLTNGISIYSSSGEAYVMDAAGNATLFSPHDAETNEWIFKSKHTPTGKVLKIDVEKMLRFINDHFGLDAIHEFTEE